MVDSLAALLPASEAEKGDNRDNSGDSRVFGFVERDLIVGKVVGLAFSLDHDRYYMPRWRRFFRAVP